jgi:Ni/Co efflux regulator RcnB
MHIKPVLYAIVASVVLGGPVLAKHSHEDPEKKHGKHKGRGDDDRGERCWFEQHDVRVIHEYYAPQYRSLPPGLAKKYYRTGRLPPGWQKKMQPLPVAVERQLVVLPGEYRRGVVDGYAVVYSPRTQVIVDVVAVFGR